MNRKNSKRRSKLEIYRDVLVGCKEPQLVTNAMYRAKMAWNPCLRVLDSLIENDMLITNGKYYQVTDKGLELISLFDEFDKLFYRSERLK